VAYVLAYPTAISILTVAFDSSGKLKKASLAVMLVLSNLQSLLHITNEAIQPEMDAIGMGGLYWSPEAFGLRGILIAVGTGLSIGILLKSPTSPSKVFH
jgi:hypothetical protein